MLSWPSSHRIRYRGDGSARTTSSTTPERGRRSVDSDSATTRLPTSKAMLTPSVFVLAEHSRHRHLSQRPVADPTTRTLLERAGRRSGAGCSDAALWDPRGLAVGRSQVDITGRSRVVAGAGASL